MGFTNVKVLFTNTYILAQTGPGYHKNLVKVSNSGQDEAGGASVLVVICLEGPKISYSQGPII